MRNKREVEEHLTPKELAERLHVDLSTVCRWMKKGKFKGTKKLGRKCVRIPASAVNAFLEEHEV